MIFCALVLECALYPGNKVSIIISILLILLCDSLARCVIGSVGEVCVIVAASHVVI